MTQQDIDRFEKAELAVVVDDSNVEEFLSEIHENTALRWAAGESPRDYRPHCINHALLYVSRSSHRMRCWPDAIIPLDGGNKIDAFNGDVYEWVEYKDMCSLSISVEDLFEVV